MSNFEVLVAHNPNLKESMVEINYDSMEFAYVIKKEILILRIYEYSDKEHWELPYEEVYPKKLEISLYSRLQTKELRLSSAVIHPIGFAVK